jgi:hypothetical protein
MGGNSPKIHQKVFFPHKSCKLDHDRVTGLCISSCKKFDLRKCQLDVGQTEVRPRFSRKISKFEGATSEVWWRWEFENHTVSNKGWTAVRTRVQPRSIAARPIFSKVEQISTGLAPSSSEGFFTFCWWVTRSAIKVEPLKSWSDLSQTSVEPRLDSSPTQDPTFLKSWTFFCWKWTEKNKKSES